LIKHLVLTEYDIEFGDWSMALIGALILAKVVLILEHVPLGDWISRQPVLVHVILRTVLYTVGVFAVLLLEKAFETRHEHGGFFQSLGSVLEHPDMRHVWVNAICLSGALLVYNCWTILQRRLGSESLAQLFLSPLPKETGDRQPRR
jgi:hypothetical protein